MLHRSAPSVHSENDDIDDLWGAHLQKPTILVKYGPMETHLWRLWGHAFVVTMPAGMGEMCSILTTSMAKQPEHFANYIAGLMLLGQIYGLNN